MGGAFVGDVEGGGHFVAVFGGVSAGGEVDTFDEVGVDDGEPLLLSAADEEGAVHFDVVDVDAVFVEGSATHVILRGELVVGGNAGLRLDEVFHGVARGGGSHSVGIFFEGLRLSCLPSHLSDADFAQEVIAWVHHHL